MIVSDYIAELDAYELRDVVAVVRNHIRTGTYFPKLAELLGPLQVKAAERWRRGQAARDREAEAKRLTFRQPTPEERARALRHWEQVKQGRAASETVAAEADAADSGQRLRQAFHEARESGRLDQLYRLAGGETGESA